MADLRTETYRHTDGSYRYRIINIDKTVLTSGGFLHEQDAMKCGKRCSGDPDFLSDVIKRVNHAN